MNKPNGLVRRKGSSVWYFRQRCPKHLQAPGDPAEIWISLATPYYAEALSKLDKAREEAQSRFRSPA